MLAGFGQRLAFGLPALGHRCRMPLGTVPAVGSDVVAAGQIEGIEFEAAQKFAISNSIWLQTRVDAARIGLDEAAFLKLLASNFAEQSRLLEKLLPVA